VNIVDVSVPLVQISIILKAHRGLCISCLHTIRNFRARLYHRPKFAVSVAERHIAPAFRIGSTLPFAPSFRHGAGGDFINTQADPISVTFTRKLYVSIASFRPPIVAIPLNIRFWCSWLFGRGGGNVAENVITFSVVVRTADAWLFYDAPRVGTVGTVVLSGNKGTAIEGLAAVRPFLLADACGERCWWVRAGLWAKEGYCWLIASDVVGTSCAIRLAGASKPESGRKDLVLIYEVVRCNSIRDGRLTAAGRTAGKVYNGIVAASTHATIICSCDSAGSACIRKDACNDSFVVKDWSCGWCWC